MLGHATPQHRTSPAAQLYNNQAEWQLSTLSSQQFSALSSLQFSALGRAEKPRKARGINLLTMGIMGRKYVFYKV